MSGGGVPLAVIPLRDGSQVQITQEGVKIGERFFALASIQDARQVSPAPETIALRVAGTGLVEFQPANMGDGARALDALFRLRPELRPAGFAPGAAPQVPYAQPYLPNTQPYSGYPTYPQYPPYPGYMPGPMPPNMPPAMPPQPGYPLPQGAPMLPPPPPGFPPPPPFGMPFAPNPNTIQGEITPFPRNFGQLLGAIFQLYGKHFRSFLLLALCVVLPLALLFGVIQTVQYVVFLGGPSCSPLLNTNPSATSCTPPTWFTTTPPTDLVFLASGIALVVLVLAILFGAWQTAALSLGARDAVLGRRIGVGASVRGGLGRLWSTLGAQFVTGLLLLLTMIPLIVLYVLLFMSVFAITPSMNNTQASHTSALFGAYFLSLCVAAPFCFILYCFFWVRLSFAPYAAATMPLGPGRAIAASWRLTRGNWWRTFFVLFLMGLIVGAVSAVGEPLALIFPPVFYLLAFPAIQVLSAPLLALTYIVLLSDLRLRSEGYAAATQDATPAGGASSAPQGGNAPPFGPPAQPGEAAQQQQSGPPLG